MRYRLHFSVVYLPHRGEELKELDSESSEKAAVAVLRKAKQCVNLGY